MLHLVQDRGVDPQRILTLAFNKKAEEELIKRSRDIGRVQIKTIHGFANRIVKENIDALGFGYTPQVAEDEDTFEHFTRRLMQTESKTGQADKKLLNEVIGIVDRARAGVTEGLFDPNVLEGEAKRFAVAYETFKSDNKLIDFQDMLIHTANLLETRPDIAKRYRSRFDFIQVDEFQDVSAVDYRYLSQLGENILAVGDDDQTIFSFRSGAGQVMQDFAKSATQYNVTENFRSTQNIVNMAKQLIEGTQAQRLDKKLFSQAEMGKDVAFVPSTPENLYEQLDKQLPTDRETAILVRTNNEARDLWNKMPEALQKRVSVVRTMHAVKGLEFDRVIVLMNSIAHGGGLYRSFPSLQNAETLVEDLEEERRLLYVAMTRAQKELVLMGDEQYFMKELGLVEGAKDTDTPDVPRVLRDVETASKAVRKNSGGLYDRFRAYYQRVRTYQDLVNMEKSGRVPIGNIIENLSAAQVHREKIEELGKQIGIRPAGRGRRARRVGMLNYLMTLPARVGQIQSLGIGAAGFSNLALADPFVAGGVGLSGYGLSKVGRRIDEALYPLARRPEQQLFYEQLHTPLPDAVRERLPDALDPDNFRRIQSRLGDPYQQDFYEFPHPTEGFEGDYSQRPLYDEYGNFMNRISEAEAESLAQEGRLTRLDTFIDTSVDSANVGITPYDPIGGDPYRRPFQRPVNALEAAVTEHFTEWRGFLEESKTSTRRPSVLRGRRRWNRLHNKLTKRLDQFMERSFDMRRANKLLTQLNRENIGTRFGGDTFELSSETTRLHTEVMNVLEDVLNPASPYYASPTDIMAGGRLHELPDGSMASADPDPTYTEGEQYTRTPRVPIRTRIGDRFRRTPRADMIESLGLVIETFDELGERVRIGSGSYLGKGRFGTALHNIAEAADGRRAVRAVVRRLGADMPDVDITGLIGADPERDLAVLQLDKANKEIRKFKRLRVGGRGEAGDALFAPGIAQQEFVDMVEGRTGTESLSGMEGARYQPHISVGSVDFGSTGRLGRFTGGSAANFFPAQSGAPVVRKGRGLLDRLFGRYEQVGAVGGATRMSSGDRISFFHQAEGFQGLMGGVVTPFEQATRGLAKESEIVENITRNFEEAVLQDVGGLRGQEKAVYTRQFEMLGRPRMQQIEDLLGRRGDTEDLLSRMQAYYEHAPMHPDSQAEMARMATELEAMDRAASELEGLQTISDQLADPLNTGAADLGRRFRGTRFGGAIGSVLEAVTPAARVAGGALGATGKVAGKVLGKALIPLEALDLYDKALYFTGTSDAMRTAEVAQGGDQAEIQRRYSLLIDEYSQYAGGGMDAFRRLLGGETAFEADYFQREGALRELGNIHESLGFAERLPVVDPVLMLIDRVEKGLGGRVVDMVSDPTELPSIP